MSLERKLNATKKIPNYPGKKALADASRPIVEPWAMRASTRVVRNLLGYWMMWNVTPGGRAGIVDRGWMGRRAAYQHEADFKYVFGVSVEEFDPSQVAYFFGLDEKPGAS